jgi:hypothetical protein
MSDDQSKDVPLKLLIVTLSVPSVNVLSAKIDWSILNSVQL